MRNPIKTWVTDQNAHHTKAIEMANKHIKRCSTSFVTRHWKFSKGNHFICTNKTNKQCQKSTEYRRGGFRETIILINGDGNGKEFRHFRKQTYCIFQIKQGLIKNPVITLEIFVQVIFIVYLFTVVPCFLFGTLPPKLHF